MLRKILALCICTIVFAFSAFASNTDPSSHFPAIKYLSQADIYQGDSHGEFKGDFLAILNDGSVWKVHPTDKDQFSSWTVDDAILVGVRTSFYFFKREHKFELRNLSREASVKVMLVKHPTNTLSVVNTSTYKTGTQVIPYTWYDSQGRPHVNYRYKDLYEKKLILNDGSIWIIRDKECFRDFNTGAVVYLGANKANDQYNYFLIRGLEREATWSWVHW